MAATTWSHRCPAGSSSETAKRGGGVSVAAWREMGRTRELAGSVRPLRKLQNWGHSSFPLLAPLRYSPGCILGETAGELQYLAACFWPGLEAPAATTTMGKKGAGHKCGFSLTVKTVRLSINVDLFQFRPPRNSVYFARSRASPIHAGSAKSKLLTQQTWFRETKSLSALGRLIYSDNVVHSLAPFEPPSGVCYLPACVLLAALASCYVVRRRRLSVALSVCSSPHTPAAGARENEEHERSR